MLTQRREIRITLLNPPVNHYTDAVQFGNLLFISGLAPLDAEGNFVGGDDPAAQACKIFESMQLILAEAGAGFGDHCACGPGSQRALAVARLAGMTA